MKLIKMEIKKYRFGEMNILPDDKGNWIPKTESECDLILKNEKEILQMWHYNAKRLNKLGRRLIKVYDRGDSTVYEVDITPKMED